MKEADYRSRRITTNQDGLHSNLEKIVVKHLQHPYQKPIATHTRLAFDAIREAVESSHQPIIFDSCCGTGLSTRQIALEYPDAIVLGIDRSSKRLNKVYADVLPDNALLIHAECADFWRLAQQAGWRPYKHFILYPNPYPTTDKQTSQ